MRNLEGDERLTQRRRVSMALVIVGQMLPAAAFKGGSAMALRYGRGTRFTRDLDAARIVAHTNACSSGLRCPDQQFTVDTHSDA